MRRIPVPLAPYAQQKAIVAEIEKQFSRLDEAVANLKRVKANLKRYKAAVLKAAVEGKLTEEWRRSERKRAQAKELEEIPRASKGKWFVYVIECENGSCFVGQTSDLRGRWQEHCKGGGAEWTPPYPPKYLIHFEEFASQAEAVEREKELNTPSGRKWIEREVAAGRLKPLVHNPDNENCLPVHGGETGQQLLERILAERRAKWEEAELAKMKAKGQVPKDDGWKRKYRAPERPEIVGLPPIPETWEWATLPQLGELNRGKSKHRPRNDPKLYGGPYPFIQTGDVRHATGVITAYSQTYSKFGLKQSRFWPRGTLCITIAANIADTGILGFDACFPDSVVGFLP